MRRGVSAGLGVLVAVALVPSTATAMHLTETGTGTASVPWGFHEYFGYGAGGWSASLAAEQTERAAAILPASSASHFPIDWASVEREQGRYDWTIPDGIYAAMRAQSLEPVMVISNAPDWARDPAATCQAQRGCMFPPLAQHDDAWQAFVQAAVERFPDVTAVEVWNEPNIERFWAPQPDPARYVELLAAAHDAVAAAGSGAQVIVGGLVASPRTTSVPASDFLRQVYAQGCACDFEGIGSHPFPRVKPLLETMWNRLTNLTEVRDANGDSATPIWITEVGVTSDPNQAAGVTAEEQGDELIRLYRSIEGHNIAAFLIYRLIDDVAGGEGPFFAQMGVLSPDLEPKPAYCELGAAIGTACDAGPPETTIDSGPSGSIASNSASFSFRSSEPGSSFQCRLDGGGLESCGSPQSYGGLADGQHTFEVVATDAAANVDPTPASRTFAVDTTPPETTVTSGPGNGKVHGSAAFSFAASETGRFECRLDAGGWSTCGSPQSYGGLAAGTHAFSVRAIDAVGNVDPSPATRYWSWGSPGEAVIDSGRRLAGTPARLAQNDNSYYEVGSTTSGNRVTSWYGRFAGVPNSLSALRVAYSGRNSSSCTQTVSIWRWPTSSWVQLNSRSVGTTEVLVEGGPGGAAADYVSGATGAGELRVRVRCSRTGSSFTARADLLRIAFDRQDDQAFSASARAGNRPRRCRGPRQGDPRPPRRCPRRPSA
jgi:hypothetical protein